jgi:hypothetical protein
MTRDEAVLLVSRALACIQIVCACIEATWIPVRLMSLHHYSNEIPKGIPVATPYLVSYYQVDIGLFFGRIALYLVFAYLFWMCGPRIARLLLPESVQASAEPPQSTDKDQVRD